MSGNPFEEGWGAGVEQEGGHQAGGQHLLAGLVTAVNLSDTLLHNTSISALPFRWNTLLEALNTVSRLLISNEYFSTFHVIRELYLIIFHL